MWTPEQVGSGAMLPSCDVRWGCGSTILVHYRCIAARAPSECQRVDARRQGLPRGVKKDGSATPRDGRHTEVKTSSSPCTPGDREHARHDLVERHGGVDLMAGASAEEGLDGLLERQRTLDL